MATDPVPKISPSLLTALKNALATAFYKKTDLEIFIKGIVLDFEIQRKLDFSAAKSTTSDILVATLAANPATYGNYINGLIADLCKMEDFSHLKRNDPLGRQESAGKAAIAKLKECVASSPAAKVTFSLQQDLAESDFGRIIAQMRSMSIQMERSPDSFRNLHEEEIRDFLLAILNSNYLGQATGETFNKSGRTDILIRVDDRNIFIAECKIWAGPDGFDAAIDQLLGYLTWRDCKCALLVFNRNKNSRAVAAKMHETIAARKEYRRTCSSLNGEDGRYVLETDEPGHEIVVATMLFDVPA